jgi:hypothetical protein
LRDVFLAGLRLAAAFLGAAFGLALGFGFGFGLADTFRLGADAFP